MIFLFLLLLVWILFVDNWFLFLFYMILLIS